MATFNACAPMPSAVLWREFLKLLTTMSSELLATYAGLGTHDGEHYYKGEECLGKVELQSHRRLYNFSFFVVRVFLACVKDLIRALRADDSRCEIRRELGRARVLQKVRLVATLHAL